MNDEFSKLEKLGVNREKLAAYQVICLPENVFAPDSTDGLLEPTDAVEFAKLLKGAGIKCASAYDLGLRTSILERRANDKWLGTIWIRDSVAVPLVVGVVSSLLAATIYSAATSSTKSPQPQIRLEIYLDKSNGVSRVSYSGDGDTLVKVLKGLEGK